MSNCFHIYQALAVCCLPCVVVCQNLVPNGDFEEFSICPELPNQIDRATGWFRETGTPDYFNRCAGNSGMGMPNGYFGYQDALFGDGYLGLAVYYAVGVAPVPKAAEEVAAIQLSQPLQVGVPVQISFWTALGGDGALVAARMRLSVPGIGIRFSTVPNYDSLLDTDPAPPLYLVGAMTDSVSWVQVCGTFVPDSAYTYVMVGNFIPDSLIEPTVVFPQNDNDIAYVFVDNVSVSSTGSPCGVGLTHQNAIRDDFEIFPNPALEQLKVKCPGTNGIIDVCRLYAMDGTVLRTWELGTTTETIELALDGIASGVYELVMLREGHWEGSTKIVHLQNLSP
ncbi:MAG: T9SS type A sorting domain-containing protein [Flavobacteriales bacterium]|nr:T9SS type A sorting domain-containing protein [Flavobacteriales bacterium]